MRKCLLFTFALLVTMLVADVARADCGISYARQVAFVQNVQHYGGNAVAVVPTFAIVNTPYVGSQVAVVPVQVNAFAVGGYAGYGSGFRNFNAGYGGFAASAVVVKQQKVVVVQQVNARGRGGFGARNANSGAVGILRAAANTVGNVAGAVIGR